MNDKEVEPDPTAFANRMLAGANVAMTPMRTWGPNTSTARHMVGNLREFCLRCHKRLATGVSMGDSAAPAGGDVTSKTRVPQAEITGIFGSMTKRFVRKKLGQVPEPLGVMWHNRPVLKAFFGFSRKADKWHACDRQLKSFAHMAAASMVGCSFCLDLAYFQARNENLDVEKAREVPRWRESGVFTSLERDVLEYAEAMSQTPPAVTDEISARLLDQLRAPALVELTAFIGAANMVTRNNVALGIKAQGFAAACGLKPLAAPSTT